MPSTSVHFPSALLADLDEMAQESGVSRNKLIVEACQESVKKRRSWPPALFDKSRFSPQELEELRNSSRQFERDIYEARKSKERSPW